MECPKAKYGLILAYVLCMVAAAALFAYYKVKYAVNLAALGLGVDFLQVRPARLSFVIPDTQTSGHSGSPDFLRGIGLRRAESDRSGARGRMHVD